jgi:hypothetical protein
LFFNQPGQEMARLHIRRAVSHCPILGRLQRSGRGGSKFGHSHHRVARLTASESEREDRG